MRSVEGFFPRMVDIQADKIFFLDLFDGLCFLSNLTQFKANNVTLFYVP